MEGEPPPESQLFAVGDPYAYKEGNRTRPVVGILKKLALFVVLRLSAKTAIFARFGAVFSHLAGASRVSGRDVILPPDPQAQKQN